MPDTNTPMIEEPVVPNGPIIDQQPTFSPMSPTQAPKQSKKRLYIVLGAVLALLIAGGIVAYLVARQQSSPQDDKTFASLNELDESLRSTFKSELNEVSIITSENGNSLAVMRKVGELTWVPVDNDAKVLSLRASRDNTEQNKADYDKLTAQMTDGGLTEVLPADTSRSQYKADGYTVQYFASEFIVCNLANGPDTTQASSDSEESKASVVLDVKCAEANNFDDNTAALKPFLVVYEASELASKADMLFRAVTSQDSAIEGYKNAEVQVATVADPYSVSFGKFYQTTDNTWHILAVTEDTEAVACTEFNTLDKQSAFIGTPCWDEASTAISLVAVPQVPELQEGDNNIIQP